MCVTVKIKFRTTKPDPEWDAENPDPGTSFALYKIYNIGNNNPVKLTRNY